VAAIIIDILKILFPAFPVLPVGTHAGVFFSDIVPVQRTETSLRIFAVIFYPTFLILRNFVFCCPPVTGDMRRTF
jgi:hypothetical protein